MRLLERGMRPAETEMQPSRILGRWELAWVIANNPKQHGGPEKDTGNRSALEPEADTEAPGK